MKKQYIILGLLILIPIVIYRKKIVRSFNKLSATTPSFELKQKVKSLEGFSRYPYQDPPGQSETYSIGYGHQIKEGEDFTSINEDDADILLETDLNDACNQALYYTDVPLTQGMLDAITDFIFNLGAGAFKNSTLRKLINDNAPKEQINDEFLKWVHVGGNISQGLVDRRKMDVQFFNA